MIFYGDSWKRTLFSKQKQQFLFEHNLQLRETGIAFNINNTCFLFLIIIVPHVSSQSCADTLYRLLSELCVFFYGSLGTEQQHYLK